MENMPKYRNLDEAILAYHSVHSVTRTIFNSSPLIEHDAVNESTSNRVSSQVEQLYQDREGKLIVQTLLEYTSRSADPVVSHILHVTRRSTLN